MREKMVQNVIRMFGFEHINTRWFVSVVDGAKPCALNDMLLEIAMQALREEYENEEAENE